MIFFLISSSLAPKDAKHLKAPCLAAAEGQVTMSASDVIRWLEMAASRWRVVSTWGLGVGFYVNCYIIHTDIKE